MATTTETITAPLRSLTLAAGSSTAKPQAGSHAPTIRKVEAEEGYKYARFLPTFDGCFKLPPLEDFEHVDPGHQALHDPTPRSFLDNATVEDITPDFGAEVAGIQLHELDTRARQQLALYVAERGVVVFRDQDFVDQDPEWQLRDWGSFWGRLHVHPVSGQPEEFPEFHLVYRDGKRTLNTETQANLTSSLWHSDVTFERQPPGLTTLFMYDSPKTGGDTAYADQRAAYEHLSPSFRAYLETLQVVHSGVRQAEESLKGQRGGIVKRDPVESIHPLVRTHPVTKKKALFVNAQFSRRIVGLKQEESDAILNLLYDHIAKGADFQARLRWKPRSVVLWDNRITAHSAIVDFGKTGERRHGARITPQAEQPFFEK